MKKAYTLEDLIKLVAKDCGVEENLVFSIHNLAAEIDCGNYEPIDDEKTFIIEAQISNE